MDMITVTVSCAVGVPLDTARREVERFGRSVQSRGLFVEIVAPQNDAAVADSSATEGLAEPTDRQPEADGGTVPPEGGTVGGPLGGVT